MQNEAVRRSRSLGMTPDDWQTATIGELGSVVTGGTPSRRRSDFWGGNIPWMSSGEIHQRRVTNTRETITDAGFDASNARWIPVGAVMVALNGQGKTRGTAAILARRMTCNQSLAAILSRQDVLVANYLFHYLSEKYVEIRRLTGDGGRNGLNLKHIRSIRVAYPPLPEQRKIAAILFSVDDAIEKTQAVIDQVQVVKRGLMQELLWGLPGRHTRFKQTEIGEIPEDWDFLSLVDLAEPGHGLQTGPFGSQLHASDYVAHGVPVIMPKDMMNGYVSDAYSARISDEMAEELRRHKVRAGDILFARRGDLGRAGLITQHEEGWICGTGCFRFRPKNRTVSRFLRHWITWPVSVLWLNEHAVGQTMLNLNTSILGRLPVALPSEAEQSTIASTMEALAEQMQALERRAEGLDTLKRSLMSVLLTGELRVTPDPETI